MDNDLRQRIVGRLSAAFGNVRDVTPAAGQPLHVLLAEIAVPVPWTPSPTRALSMWEGWPDNRPAFYIDARVKGSTGQAPRNPSPTYLLGETWNAFSFSFAWRGDDPVRAIQTWLTRFEEPT